MPVEIFGNCRAGVGSLAGTGLRVLSLGRIMLIITYVPATGVRRGYLPSICIVDASRSEMQAA